MHTIRNNNVFHDKNIYISIEILSPVEIKKFKLI